MKSKFLFPTWCAIVGYLLAIPGFILGYLYTIKDYEIPGFGFKMWENDGFFQKAFENFTNELAIFLVIIGLILIAFAKEKKEDELSAKLRLNSLYWSIMIYYVLYIIGYLYTVIFGEILFIGDHFTEMNLFTPLVIFICRYNYLKYINAESYQLSKPKFLPNKPFKSIGIVFSGLGLTSIITSLLIDSNKKWVEITQISFYVLLIFGLLFWAFAKNKEEDEMTMQQRLEGLQLSIYFNYAIILLLTLIAYSLLYLYVLMFAQFSILLFFVIRMEFITYRNNKLLNTFEGGMSYEK
ncbi:MAG: hypothetical protein EOO90_27895 [Pedobacter sp.]|nr:MAG: hypothetical protein EOO90_27895 [Pedobacter sp.]